MSDDFESLLFGGDPEPEPPPSKTEKSETPIVVKNPLPEEEYLCPTCGKTYRAIFLARPVNYDCTSCFYKSVSRPK